MASISTPEVDAIIRLGSTWGTAVAVDTVTAGQSIHLSQLSITDGFEEFQPRDIGFDNFVTKITRMKRSVGVNITCDLAYHGAWLFILACIMGGDSVSGSTPEYTHTMDLTSNNNGKFTTMAFKVEDDYALEMPSIKWTSFTIQSDANGVGTFSAQGIADRIVDNASVVNTITKINAASYPTYDAAVLGGTNHYFRTNTASGSGLTSGEDKNILSYSISISRPFNPRFTLRGANSAYTLEPRQLGPTIGTTSFKMSEINDATIDGYNEFLSQTKKKIELFCDGTLISAVNASMKIQIPAAESKMPQGYDIPNNSSLMQPTYTYNLLKAAAAPTGMSGVTNYARFVFINERASAYA